jgi:hypothetical protein
LLLKRCKGDFHLETNSEALHFCHLVTALSLSTAFEGTGGNVVFSAEAWAAVLTFDHRRQLEHNLIIVRQLQLKKKFVDNTVCMSSVDEFITALKSPQLGR